MESRFNFFSIILVPTVAIALATNLILAALNPGKGYTSINGAIAIYLFLFIVLLFLLRNIYFETIKVNFDEKEVVVQNFFGLAPPRRFKYNDFDGFHTSRMSSRGKDYNYLYLMKDGKKIIKISDFYHSNYSFLFAEAQAKLKDLGFIRTNMVTEIQDIFKTTTTNNPT